MKETQGARPLKHLKDLWDEAAARNLDEPELLRYRSNLLGADHRITNFGGGNTSSKIPQTDPLDGKEKPVLWVKGSGGDLGSIQRRGFATLYLDKIRELEKRYRGVEHEDEMVEFYPLCAFGVNSTAASIDTPLHSFLPFPHVDHLHPDWGIALAASANGRAKLEEFNKRFGHRLAWIPWQRPGFELAMMLRRAVEENPQADGVVLGGHGLFTWGETQRQCYLNTLQVIDQLGQFVNEHLEKGAAKLFGGARHATRDDRRAVSADLFPYLRGRVSQNRRLIGNFTDLPEVLRFVNSQDAPQLAHLGTSCPDHFLRTKIRPLLVPWDPAKDTPAQLRQALDESLRAYRKNYEAYYHAHARPDSPPLRDPNPTVVLVPGVGLFSFGKNKPEARVTGEFYVNAIHVMEGATALGSGPAPNPLPQAGAAAPSESFQVHNNYVALPPAQAFGIEYWALEEAKLRRRPPEKEFSRQVMMIVGGGAGIGREVALMAAGRGAHVVIGDRDAAAARAALESVRKSAGAEAAASVELDIRNRDSIRRALAQAIEAYGGVDVLINTAAMYPSSADGAISDEQWRQTLDVNVTGNYLLADEARKIFADQDLPGAIVLTSSANAVVPKAGSEAYDVSKAAISHLVRELALALAPRVRVNGICPATVVKGSTMFPRDRVLASLEKYKIEHSADEPTEELRAKLARFYAARTLTQTAIDPRDCAETILFLAGERARCTTGHLVPVDGGLKEAFLR